MNICSVRESKVGTFYGTNFTNKIKVGDIVLIKSPNRFRPYWMLSRVLSLVYVDDQCVRTVKIKRWCSMELLFKLS